MTRAASRASLLSSYSMEAVRRATSQIARSASSVMSIRAPLPTLSVSPALPLVRQPSVTLKAREFLRGPTRVTGVASRATGVMAVTAGNAASEIARTGNTASLARSSATVFARLVVVCQATQLVLCGRRQACLLIPTTAHGHARMVFS